MHFKITAVVSLFNGAERRNSTANPPFNMDDLFLCLYVQGKRMN